MDNNKYIYQNVGFTVSTNDENIMNLFKTTLDKQVNEFAVMLDDRIKQLSIENPNHNVDVVKIRADKLLEYTVKAAHTIYSTMPNALVWSWDKRASK